MLATLKQTTKLPVGFYARPAQLEDLHDVVNLAQTCSVAQIGAPEFDEAELRSFWTAPKFDMAGSTLVIENAAGTVIAYADIDDTSAVPVQPMIWGRVHPDYEGMGIGSAIIQWGENSLRRVLSRVPQDLRVAARCFTLSSHQPTSRLFTDFNYQMIRHFWRMEIELEQEPAQPVWPDNITLTTFAKFPDLRAVVAATDDGFKDHWGHVNQPLADLVIKWQHWISEDPNHDPTLWFLAMDGVEITAVSLCRPFATEDREMGWVNQLAVRRPWRRRGLGLAVLQHSICEFYRRGQKRVGLGVDASSLTGATRLYEKAGMRVSRQYDTYEKELRSGRRISTETIA